MLAFLARSRTAANYYLSPKIARSKCLDLIERAGLIEQ